MRRLTDNYRIVILIAALACFAMMATGITLSVHLETHHHNHEEQHESHEGKGPLPLQDHSCHTCQFLLGVSGKYICITSTPLELSAEQDLFTCNIDSQCIYQHQLGPLAARGPPVS